MILREATIKYKGYDPEDLSKGSHKRVCKSCNMCGRVSWIGFKSYKNLCSGCSKIGLKRSNEICQKMSDIRKGKNHPLYGKRGKDSPNYGKHRSDESRKRMSESRMGNKSSQWKGGIAGNRDHILPKFKCIKLNKYFTRSHFHHITKSIGIYIPKELHQHIWHNMKSGQGMSEINMLALQFINGRL